MNLYSTGSIFRPTRSARTARKTFALATFLWTFWSPYVSSQTANPEQLFKEAVEAQQRGEDAVAVSKYKELLSMHPEAVAVRVNLGATLAPTRSDSARQSISTDWYCRPTPTTNSRV